MRYFAQLLLLTCVAFAFTGAPPVEAQAPNSDARSDTTAFEREFGIDDVSYGQRLRRLRLAGWFGFGIAMTVGFSALADVLVNEGDRDEHASGEALMSYLAVGVSISIMLAASSACLIAARIKVIRRARFRRRFRERQAALDRSYFHPELDIGITPGGLSLYLSF